MEGSDIVLSSSPVYIISAYINKRSYNFKYTIYIYKEESDKNWCNILSQFYIRIEEVIQGNPNTRQLLLTVIDIISVYLETFCNKNSWTL